MSSRAQSILTIRVAVLAAAVGWVAWFAFTAQAQNGQFQQMREEVSRIQAQAEKSAEQSRTLEIQLEKRLTMLETKIASLEFILWGVLGGLFMLIIETFVSLLFRRKAIVETKS